MTANSKAFILGLAGGIACGKSTVAARLAGFADGLTRLFGKHEELPPKEDAEK